MKKIIIIVFGLMASTLCLAQNEIDISFNFQAYPTGLIPGISVEKGMSDNSSLIFRIGYNWFDHRDLGVHDEEEGGGFGGTIGYRKFLSSGRVGWSLALKSDFWWNHVDWKDITPVNQIVTGETDITVLQPTLELGYTILKNSNLIITPSLALGYEWNVRTSGAPTGEGSIILLGISIGKRM